MKTVIAILLSFVLCSLSQTIQVTNCTTQTFNCGQCMNAVNGSTPCMWCAGTTGGYCDLNTSSCAATFTMATTCTDTCAPIGSAANAQYAFLNYTMLNQSTANYTTGMYGNAVGKVGTGNPFGGSLPTLSTTPYALNTDYLVGTYAAAPIAFSYSGFPDPFINLSNATCFVAGAAGGFFDISVVRSNCYGYLNALRYGFFMNMCGGPYKLCPATSGCGAIATECAPLIASGCYNLAGVTAYCGNGTEPCNSEIGYDFYQSTCNPSAGTTAIDLISCTGALNIGCNVCNGSYSQYVAATLSATSHPCPPGYNALAASDCNALSTEQCLAVTATLNVNFPSGFMTKTAYCNTAPTPVAPSNATSNATASCYDNYIGCNLTEPCRGALVAYQTYLTCKPCSNIANHQIAQSACLSDLSSCLPYFAQCPGSQFTKSGLSLLGQIGTICTNGTSSTDGYQTGPSLIKNIDAGCAQSTGAATTSGAVTAGATGAATGTTGVATSTGMAGTTTGMVATSTTGTATGVSGASTTGIATTTTGTPAPLTTTTGSPAPSSTTSGGVVTTTTTTGASPSPTHSNGADSGKLVSFLAVILSILACIIAF